MKTTEEDTTTKPEAMPVPTAKVKVSDKDELEVWVVGEGTPVVMVHGALTWSILKPLGEELAEKGGNQVIWYHRRGYRGNSTKPVELAAHAPDIVKILDELGISKAHVVGHSLGANIGLELAMHAPDRLLSVIMLEPVMFAQVESVKQFAEAMKPIFAKVESGELKGASEDFLGAIGLSEEVLERAVPGSWEQMLTDCPTWWKMGMPALQKWTVDPEKVNAIEIPLAFVLAADLPHLVETVELLQKWQPKLKRLEIPSSEDHFFMLKQTSETAAVLDDWIKSQGTTN